jgi:hypothetical protein
MERLVTMVSRVKVPFKHVLSSIAGVKTLHDRRAFQAVSA